MNNRPEFTQVVPAVDLTREPDFTLGRIEVRPSRRQVVVEGREEAVQPRVMQVLVALARANGAVISRKDLIEGCWNGLTVSEDAINQSIAKVRRIAELGGREFDIETIARVGYKLKGVLSGSPSPDSRVTESDIAGRVMLVVLPFENLTQGEEKHDYFSDGLTEEMITQLARLSPSQLGVIARTSSMHYKSTIKTVGQIGQELGVSHVLEGSVRRVGACARITAQLIRVSDECHVWAQSYQRSLNDVLALQAEVARAIAREVQIKLTAHEQRRLDLDNNRNVDSQAYELYLRGRHFWYKRTEDGMRNSIACFEQAIRHDPCYAPAYHGVSAHTMLACRGIVPASEAFHKAKTAARQALQFEPELGEGYASLAHVRLHDWDWVGLEEEFSRAIEFNPGHAITHYWYAEYLMAMGRCGEAVTRAKHSLRWDPVNPVLYASVGMILYLAHRYDDALAVLRQGVEIDPSHYVLHLRMGLVYQQKCQPKRAIAAMQQAVTLSEGGTEALAGLAQSYAAANDSVAARRIVDELNESEKRYVSPYNIARIYGSLAEPDRALEWLAKAYEEHNPDLIEVTREPALQSLHGNSRFRELTRRIGW